MTIYRNNPLLMTVMGANPGPRRKRPVDDPIDHAIGQAWHRLMSGIQVPVMDIPRIFRDVKLEMAAGMPLEEAVLRVGQRYQVNRNGYRRNPSLMASLAGGMAGAFVTHAMSNPGPSFVVIDSETGRVAYTKRATGLGDAAIRAASARARELADRNGRSYIVFLDIRGLRVGSTASLPMVRALGITDEIFPGGRSNPLTRTEAGRVLRRARKGLLAAKAYRPGAPRRTWRLGQAAGRAQVVRSHGPKSAGRAAGALESRAIHAYPNPGPRGKRKLTMTVERFAQWVKSKRDPVMWRAFLAKFKGYEKWTHGAKSRRVTLEWQDVPGMTGLWITYDGGRQPESTYIMPKGSPRKGAWKHPWDTMPEIKHDPEAKVVLTKLRGKSKITDFYHK